MKLFAIVSFLSIFTFPNLAAQEYGDRDFRNTSISFDPLTFVGLLLGSGEYVNFRNMWFAMNFNWETPNQREIGVGAILRANRVAVKTQYRMFRNRETQSGFFWGFYGLIEWRRMFWYHDSDNGLSIGWSFPFTGNDNVYHSIGVTGGLDIGFRFRRENFGITPFLGLGIPLFLTFGDLPPENNMQEFIVSNTALRAINIGLRLDLFPP